MDASLHAVAGALCAALRPPPFVSSSLPSARALLLQFRSQMAWRIHRSRRIHQSKSVQPSYGGAFIGMVHFSIVHEVPSFPSTVICLNLVCASLCRLPRRLPLAVLHTPGFLGISSWLPDDDLCSCVPRGIRSGSSLHLFIPRFTLARSPLSELFPICPCFCFCLLCSCLPCDALAARFSLFWFCCLLAGSCWTVWVCCRSRLGVVFRRAVCDVSAVCGYCGQCA